MSTPPISITSERSGSVVAKGATDELSAALMKHAGFQQIDDWHGRRHRLPTTTSSADKAAVATHAAEMLRAARYQVDLPPSLDTTEMITPARPFGPYVASAEVEQLTQRIGAARDGDEFRRAVDHLLHPEYGVLECVREALEVAGEHVNDLDHDAYDQADQFAYAAGDISSALTGLAEMGDALRDLKAEGQPEVPALSPAPGSSDSQKAALASSPAATKAAVAPAADNIAPRTSTTVPRPNAPGPRR
ncbi:hypothetical protein [Streptomyces sp. PTY087I2]|uniref:hypothetical protein n=1 Tax=Streptomyces sp. PTY087I2 TaxID=1819298 RepID=UPI00080B461A|nr:hypothetical protein [Streptomyces sp. PTY087I2]OCC11538.1 hypothetical protein A3Q37_02735 [Streptomyces sp. PTY087I2]